MGKWVSNILNDYFEPYFQNFIDNIYLSKFKQPECTKIVIKFETSNNCCESGGCWFLRVKLDLDTDMELIAEEATRLGLDIEGIFKNVFEVCTDFDTDFHTNEIFSYFNKFSKLKLLYRATVLLGKSSFLKHISTFNSRQEKPFLTITEDNEFVYHYADKSKNLGSIPALVFSQLSSGHQMELLSYMRAYDSAL